MQDGTEGGELSILTTQVCLVSSENGVAFHNCLRLRQVGQPLLLHIKLDFGLHLVLDRTCNLGESSSLYSGKIPGKGLSHDS